MLYISVFFWHRVPPSALFHIYSNKDKIRSKNIIIYQLYVLIYACFLEAFAPKYIFGFVLVFGVCALVMFYINFSTTFSF